MPGKHVTCFCFSLRTGFKESVLEFSKEAILGITTGDLLVRILVPSTKHNTTHRKLLLKESEEGVYLERRYQESPLSRRDNRKSTSVEVNGLECQWVLFQSLLRAG